MLCRSPYSNRDGLYPCGRCKPCRIRKRREWTHRLMLEASLREDNCFVTLTYDDEHLPFAGSLDPQEASLWLKRFRERYRMRNGREIRFYLVGEYGDEKWRPHYHVGLFNVEGCSRGRTRRDVRNRVQWRGCCSMCDLVGESWGKGDIEIGVLETKSAQYLAGYIVKKMTKADDPRLEGRYPEFARMSLRPGIGHDFMFEYASTLMQHALDEKLIDVPVALRHGAKELPLGRYLRRKLRVMVGKDEKAPPEALKEWVEKMQGVFERALYDEESVGSAKRQYQKETAGKLASFEAKQLIFGKRRGVI